jgi:hypothetical protein
MKKCFVLPILFFSFCLPVFAQGYNAFELRMQREQRERELMQQRTQQIKKETAEMQRKFQQDRVRANAQFDAAISGMMDAQARQANAADNKFANDLARYRTLNAQGRRQFLQSMSAADRQNFEIRYYRTLSRQEQNSFYPTMSQGAKKYVDEVNNFGRKTFGAQWTHYGFTQLERAQQNAQMQERIGEMNSAFTRNLQQSGNVQNQILNNFHQQIWLNSR